MEKAMHKTIQREAILKLLRESEKHLSADEVFTILRYKVPQISLATIYRNLKQLSAAQIISEVTTINIQKKLESNMSVHFHIHCPVCGKLTDVQYDSLVNIDEILLAKTKELNCDGYHLEFLAKCTDCIERSVRQKT